jgi:phage/conjugal plasmid C-4 type zinc finger TraR family protein
MDFGDEGQAAEAFFREAALSAASRPAPAGHQVVEAGRIVCAECGQPIPLARLVVLPEATRCRDCQEEIEG